MVAVSSRNNFWFILLFILMIVGGVCIVGYWQTYTINCGGAKATWTWTKVPPQFECRRF